MFRKKCLIKILKINVLAFMSYSDVLIICGIKNARMVLIMETLTKIVVAPKLERFDDKFKTGISKLTLLSNDLDKIQTTDSLITQDISYLKEIIHKDIKSTMEFKESFGFVMLNGLSSLLGGSSKDDKTSMPKATLAKFKTLKEDLQAEQIRLLQNLNSIEGKETDSLKLTSEQLKEIRASLIENFKSSLTKNSTLEDSNLFEKLEKTLLESYDDIYPLNNLTTENSIEREINTIIQKEMSSDWQVETDGTAKWYDYYMKQFILPERKTNPHYPYIAIGNFDNDKDSLKNDYAAIIINIKDNSKKVVLIQNKKKVFVLSNYAEETGISTIARYKAYDMFKDVTTAMPCDGVNIVAYEKGSEIYYIDSDKVKTITTSD